MPRRTIDLGEFRQITPSAERTQGNEVLSALVNLAEDSATALRDAIGKGNLPSRIALYGRIRGNGRGVSFRALVTQLEAAYPLTMESPFEGSEFVSGGVWVAGDILSTPSPIGIAKLRWSKGAKDLPIHVHEDSERFIIVLEGRGFFHVSGDEFLAFSPESVRSIPARERDVFLFSRGTLHTFSTEDHEMTLLSCQVPHVPFDDPHQYRVPDLVWTADKYRDAYEPAVGCDPAWSVLTSAGADISAGR